MKLKYSEAINKPYPYCDEIEVKKKIHYKNNHKVLKQLFSSLSIGAISGYIMYYFEPLIVGGICVGFSMAFSAWCIICLIDAGKQNV